jgi:hypothetical protein
VIHHRDIEDTENRDLSLALLKAGRPGKRASPSGRCSFAVASTAGIWPLIAKARALGAESFCPIAVSGSGKKKVTPCSLCLSGEL